MSDLIFHRCKNKLFFLLLNLYNIENMYSDDSHTHILGNRSEIFLCVRERVLLHLPMAKRRYGKDLLSEIFRHDSKIVNKSSMTRTLYR